MPEHYFTASPESAHEERSFRAVFAGRVLAFDTDAGVFSKQHVDPGSELLCQLLERDHIQISDRHEDCGLLLYDRKKQDVHAGGSGCGCSAGVLNGHILPEMRAGRLHDVLFAATGALLSPTMVQQGETIPGIAHLVHLRMEQGGNNGCSSNC